MKVLHSICQQIWKVSSGHRTRKGQFSFQSQRKAMPKSAQVQFSSVAQWCPTLCDPVNCSTPGLPVHHQLPEFTQTHVHRVGDAIQSSHPLSSPCPPAPIPPSIRVFSDESTLRIRWPKYWSFSLSISPSKEHPGLISFMMDWLDLLAVKGTLKSLLQHHSSKASILWRSASQSNSHIHTRASLVAQMAKNLPTRQETQVRSLG